MNQIERFIDPNLSQVMVNWKQFGNLRSCFDVTLHQTVKQRDFFTHPVLVTVKF